jgi:hypothetical protein
VTWVLFRVDLRMKWGKIWETSEELADIFIEQNVCFVKDCRHVASFVLCVCFVDRCLSFLFWPFEEISIFSNGGHLGYRTALTDTILKGDLLRIISAKFGWNWLSSFRGEDFFYFQEISSNGQNCSILSQKVPKFELYKHNDELFNIYYGIFYELWTLTGFDRLWNKKKGGWNCS